MMNVSLLDIQKAQKRIQPFVKKTSLKKSEFFSKKIGRDIFLKWEIEQEIKSFKIRGALNKVFSLTDEEKQKGLIAASAGNHAQGVSLAARYSKVKARVVMMETASKVKVESTRKFGAEVILKGKTYDDSYTHARFIQGDSIFIHPFDDPLIIAGQGTLALEILQEEPDITSFVFAIGGGGLISGNSFAIKHLKPECKVYGAVWEGTPSFCKNYHKNQKPCTYRVLKGIDALSKSGLTDGLAVKKSNPKILEFCAPYIDDIVCVTEDEISKTIVDTLEYEKQVVEGSGVAALAAAIKNKDKWDLGKKPCVIISGGNIDPSILADLVKKYSGDSKK